jgi:hypothetical protein
LEIISLNLIEQTKRLYQQNKITRQISLFYKIFANLKKTEKKLPLDYINYILVLSLFWFLLFCSFSFIIKKVINFNLNFLNLLLSNRLILGFLF